MYVVVSKIDVSMVNMSKNEHVYCCSLSKTSLGGMTSSPALAVWAAMMDDGSFHQLSPTESLAETQKFVYKASSFSSSAETVIVGYK